MKKNIFVRILTAALCVMTASVLLTACGGGGDKECKHEWKDATCTSPKTCSLCNATEGKALGHDFGDWETTTAATCVDAGEKTRTCKRCNHKETDTIAALGHDLEQIAKKDATCTVDGYEAYEACKNCDYETEKKVIKAKHKYETTVIPSTCTKDGYTLHECSVCHDRYEDEKVVSTGHAWGGWYVAEKTTLESDGLLKNSCMNCDEVYEKAPTVISEGTFQKSYGGSSITYKLVDETGTLVINGTGTTLDCGEDGAAQPFADYRDKITEILISEGVVTIDKGSFANLKNLTKVTFPSTLELIEDYAFYGSFKSSITSLTIPESVTELGIFSFGCSDDSAAIFTDITIENPETKFHTTKSASTFNGGAHNSKITLSSKGASNKVSTLATKIGAKYVDISAVITGTVENLSYRFLNGMLNLSAVDPSVEAVLPESAPWLSEILKTEITQITIGDGIRAIPMNYFKDYTALISVSLPDTVTRIGSGAFATTAESSSGLNINFPESVETLGTAIFENRTNVKVSASDTPAMDNFSEPGVTLDIFRSFKLLLIGNSLSQDASDCQGGSGSQSQLYNIVKAMLGENSYVEIGIAYGGAKTAAWHATRAEKNDGGYAFNLISDETEGLWSSLGGSTFERALTYTDWDYVTIQPYSGEATIGTASMNDTDAYKEVNGEKIPDKDEKFLPLNVSLPFLLDSINGYAPDAEVYYYMTWGNSFSSSNPPTLDANLSELVDKRVFYAKEAMTYKGPDSGSMFTGVINGGTAIQHARRTYLGLLNYQDGDKRDDNYGLQRDSVHLSYHVGRYVVGLTFAEILIPENRRAPGYVLPDIMESDVIGELPAEYTEIARLAASEAAKAAKATGDAQYKPVEINGYEVDPAKKLAAKVETLSFENITATDKTALEKAVKALIDAEAKDGMVVYVEVNGTPSISATASAFNATATLTFGYTTVTVNISGTVKNA